MDNHPARRRGRPRELFGHASVSAQLFHLLARRPEAKEWSCRRVARELGVTHAAVVKSPAWRALMVLRRHGEHERAGRLGGR